MCLSRFSHVQLCETLGTVACQAPLSMGFSSQEYWCGLLFPSPGDLPDPGIEPEFPASPALAGGFFTTEPPGKPTCCVRPRVKLTVPQSKCVPPHTPPTS